MLKYIIHILLLFILFVFCNTENNPSQKQYNISRASSIDLKLSSIIDSIIYINLDNTPLQAMIGRVERIKINDNHIMVVHRKSSLREISIFSTQGKFVQNYNIAFESEYNKYMNSIKDACFSRKGTSVYIYDILKNSICEFDFNGYFIGSQKLEYLALQIYETNHGLIIYSGFSIDINNGYTIHIKDLNNKFMHFYEIPEFLKDNIRISMNFSFCNEEFVYHDKFDPNIYIFNKDSLSKLATINYDGFFNNDDMDKIKQLEVNSRSEFINTLIIHDNKYPGYQVVHYHRPYLIAKIHDRWILINMDNDKTIIVKRWINDLDSSTLGELEQWPIWYRDGYLYFFTYKENFNDDLHKALFNENIVIVKAKLKNRIELLN